MNNNMSNSALLAEIGVRLKSLRVEQNKDQQQLAYEAGLSLRTLSRLENGHSVSFEAVLKIIRTLGLIERFDLFLPSTEISPVQQAKNKDHKPRQRASGKRDKTTDKMEHPQINPVGSTSTTSNKKEWSGFKKPSTFEASIDTARDVKTTNKEQTKEKPE